MGKGCVTIFLLVATIFTRKIFRALYIEAHIPVLGVERGAYVVLLVGCVGESGERGARSARKTYFSDNDNGKGKYSDENSPIRRAECARVEVIKGGRVLLNDIFRRALLLLLTHSSDIGYPIVVYQKRFFCVHSKYITRLTER